LHDGRPAFGVKGPAGNVIGLAQILGRFGVEAAIFENGTIEDIVATTEATAKRNRSPPLATGKADNLDDTRSLLVATGPKRPVTECRAAKML
jgi:hypothetical protein